MADLNKSALPGDAIVVVPPEQIYDLGSYADPSLQLTPLPSEVRPVSQADLDSLAALAQQHSRLWLVQGDTESTDPDGLLAGWLAGNAYRPARRGTGRSSSSCTPRRRTVLVI